MEKVIVAPLGDGRPFPWLVFVSGEKLENQVFYDVISNPKTTDVVRNIPETTTNTSVVMPTNINGWLLLKLDAKEFEPSYKYCLWNVITLQTIDLPLIKVFEYHIKSIDYVLLTKSPNDCDCMVLLMLHDLLGILHCCIDENADWIFMDYQEELMDFDNINSANKLSCPITYDDNKITMISHSNVVAKIEIVKTKRLIIKPDLSFPRMPHNYNVGPGVRGLRYRVACCGDLFVIYVSFGGLEWNEIESVTIFKLDFLNMSWNKVDSCPNASFFISHKQCIAYPTNSNKAGNHVFIVDDVIYTYHIQQKTLKTSLIATPKDKMSIPYWVLVSDPLVLAGAEKCYRNGGDDESNQLFDNRENIEVHKNNADEEKKYSILLDDLPIDILKTILSNLINPSNYLNFRATSRSFRDAFPVKGWSNMRASDSDRGPSPWLIFPNSQQAGYGKFSMVDPILCNQYYVRTPETLEENSRICCSENGWLLMSSPYIIEDIIYGKLNLFFYNPLTKCTVRLPEFPRSDASHFLFSGSPDHDDSFVIGISQNMSNMKDGTCPFFYVTHNESVEGESDKWVEWYGGDLTVENDDGMFVVQQSNVNAVRVGGVSYFLVGGGNMACISYDDRTLRIHKLEEPCSRSSYVQLFLAEYDEEIISIYIGNEWKWLRAFKFNESGMVWDEVKELKNNNLYLSYVSSTTSEPQSANDGNRIYFSRFYQDSIAYYSFNTHKFHISDGKDSILSDYQLLKEQMYSCWLQIS